MSRPLIAALLCCIALTAGAVDGPLESLMADLEAGRAPAPERLEALSATPDGLFVRGWLHEYGSYGVSRDEALARDLFRRAAAQGHIGVLVHCWQSCLEQTGALEDQVQAAARAGDGAGLYLRAQLHLQAGDAGAADHDLRAAAEGRYPQAIDRLYVQHFLDWAAAGRRDFAAARDKLRRCTEEGVAVCYYLLGALQERHRDHEAALLNYRILELVDGDLFRQYLSQAYLAGLERRLTAGSRAVIEARVAQALVRHSPTGFDRVGRFRACAPEPSYACVVQLARHDDACIPRPLATTRFAGFRQTQAYRRCLAEAGANAEAASLFSDAISE